MFKKNLPKIHLPLNRSFDLQTSQHRNEVLLSGEGWEAGGPGYVPSLNFKTSHFPYWAWGHTPIGIALLYMLYLQLSLLLSQFHPIFMSFVTISYDCVKSLFQGHVALWNFTLKGPQWFKLRSQQNRQIIALSHKYDITYNTHCI